MSDRKPVIISEEQLEEQRQYIQQIRLMPDAPKSYHVVTYGCQMNAHDSEILAGMLRDMGMEEAADRESADFVLFNTCCVRDNAERRALGNVTWLKEVRKKNPRLMIGVCGCMIQQPGMAEKILKQYRFVDLAFGTANLYRLPELMLKALESDHAVVEVEEQNTIAEGLPVQRLRLRQLLHLLHRAVCARAGAFARDERDCGGSRSPAGQRREGNHAAGAECEQLRQGTPNARHVRPAAQSAG